MPNGNGISIWYPPGRVWYRVLDDDKTTGMFAGVDNEHYKFKKIHLLNKHLFL